MWLMMVYWIFGTNTSCPFKAMQSGILSIIQATNKPNCWQEALNLHLVSENELLKPNQFRCLEIHRLLPLHWFKTGLWLAKQTHNLAKQGWFFLWKPSPHQRAQMMMFWPIYFDLFTGCLNFSLIYIQFHVIFLSINNPSMQRLHILSDPFLTFLPDKVSLTRTFVNLLSSSDLLMAGIAVVNAHQQRSMTIHTYIIQKWLAADKLKTSSGLYKHIRASTTTTTTTVYSIVNELGLCYPQLAELF